MEKGQKQPLSSDHKDKKDNISLIIVEDHPVVVEGLQILFNSSGRYNLDGVAGTGKECLHLLKWFTPDVLLLDKTGTITLGNRMATDFIPAEGVTIEELADAAQLSSLSDETPEGRSIVVLAKEKFNIRGREVHQLQASFIPFSAQTRMSGVDFKTSDGILHQIRKGASDHLLKKQKTVKFQGRPDVRNGLLTVCQLVLIHDVLFL